MGKKRDFETPAPESAGDTAPTERMTQREAVTQALAAGQGQPTEGVAYIRETFGLRLTNQSFSTLKSQIKKAARTQTPPARAHALSNGSLTARSGTSVGKAASPAELARDVKHLVARYGADAVKQMVDVFAD